jgi:hypothetical protein
MIGKEFLRAVTKGRRDLLGLLLRLLRETEIDYCVIGGLAVNAYAEPVVSLDLDIVVVGSKIETLTRAASLAGCRVDRFEHSVNLSAEGSDLRIQVQTDPRYQDFLARAEERVVLGYRMRVAALEDVLQGKLWACNDTTRRASKRQKDVADILRLIEAHPALRERVPGAFFERGP